MLTHVDSEPVAHDLACAQAMGGVFAALDGELAPDTASRIETHLDACAECRARFVSDAAFHRVVRAAATLDTAPPTLRERIAHLLHATATENASA
jgi:mycothiol system anti-sigma-R factor